MNIFCCLLSVSCYSVNLQFGRHVTESHTNLTDELDVIAVTVSIASFHFVNVFLTNIA